jgi:hypothetical protein
MMVRRLAGFVLRHRRHLIQNIGGLMHPATLLGDWAVFFLQSDPEAQLLLAPQARALYSRALVHPFFFGLLE